MLTELRMQEIQLKTLILTKLRWHFNWKHSCCTYKTVNVFQLKTPLLTKLRKHFSWKHSYCTYGTANAFQLKTLVTTKQCRHFNWKLSYLRSCESISIENTHTVLTELRSISIENTRTVRMKMLFLDAIAIKNSLVIIRLSLKVHFL